MIARTWHNKPLKFAAFLSLILFFAKLAAYVLTGSLLVLGSLFDSLADTLSSLTNHKIHKMSLEKADKEHPFGHGGYEVIGSLIQGMILGFLGISLFIESVRRYFSDDYIVSDSLLIAAGIMAFASLGGFAIQIFLKSQLKKFEARHERSLSLLSDRAHYHGDAWVNGIGAIFILAVYYTGIKVLDIVGGCIASVALVATSVPILIKCFRDITHNEASAKLQQIIVDIALSVDPRVKGVHQLRSRELGPLLFVDFHMQVQDDLSLKEAHDIGDRVVAAITKIIQRADVLIHLDPESEPEQRAWDPSYKLREP